MTFEDCKAEIQGGGLWSGHGALPPWDRFVGGNGGELGTHSSKKAWVIIGTQNDGLENASPSKYGYNYNWVSMLDFRGVVVVKSLRGPGHFET